MDAAKTNNRARRLSVRLESKSSIKGQSPKEVRASDVFVPASSSVAPKFLGADLLAKALEANGYQLIPFNPGASEEVIASALERRSTMQPVLAYQELSALGFAAGVALGSQGQHAQPNGNTRAAVIAHGMVGLGGMASFISGYAQQKLPLLILIGNAGVDEDSLMKHQNPNGGLAQAALGAGCKEVLWATSPETLVLQLKRATMLAESGTPGPVALVIPQNGVMASDADPNTLIERVPAATRANAPSPEAVETLAKQLRKARRPVLLVGDEVARSGAVKALIEVAERTGARVVGSMAHELCFPMNHPLWAGSTGHLFGESARKVLAEADCVISIGGVDVSTVFPTRDAPYDAKAWVSYVGTDDGAAAAMYRASGPPVLADPKATLEQLAQALQKHETPAARAAVANRTEQVAQKNHDAKAARLEQARTDSLRVPLHAYDVTRALREVIAELGLEDKVIIFNEGLTRAGIVEDVLEPQRPGAYFSSQGGSLGYAGPMASGLARTNPDKTVIALSGDGGFLYTPQWLLTAQEQGLNVKSIVFKDEVYGLLHQAAAAQGRNSPDTFSLGAKREHVIRAAPVDYVKLADALGGVQGERVANRADLKAALIRLLTSEGPALIEAVTPVP